MAAQKCPNCKEDSFTWKVDDEISDLTVWSCFECNYQAFENELEEQYCSECVKKTKSKLSDKEKDYWWCSNCNTVEVIR
ncbi:hypothetical protein [Seonamhaeicola maritimus]|uniref:Uncharacterized protein n=1 Tax=Seonamhaeicola maritimus TaxID=2591822 RepID=A0A5C7GIL0_9FLAO|nr:hypothetical protein [Seonamhaeicola maritimus]TXG37357.1 hypothetical protein FUA22_12445 [Seonamhaeicola maritimus]